MKNKKISRRDQRLNELQEQVDILTQMNVMMHAELACRIYPGRMTFEDQLRESHDSFLQMAKELEERRKAP